MRVLLQTFTVAVGSLLLLVGACGESGPSGTADSESSATHRLRLVAEPGPGPAIVLSQAQFLETTDEKTGEKTSTPGPARLVILRQHHDEWQPEFVEDPESNVFHKAVFYPETPQAGQTPGILTIGANAAMIKLWQHSRDAWSAETVWKATFGGKQDRLRDFEIGDVTADGKPDIVIVTHDQGVVVVLSQTADGWQATEIDHKEKTFVHETELGDLDGDGALEIYATPSKPNKFDGTPQPGEIVVYRHSPEGFERQVVEEFLLRHVKEILVTDIDGDGHSELLASVEAELASRPDAPPDADQVLVKRYRFEADRYVGEVVCTLPDGLCRFFNAGDVDGDGKPELIASTHKKGIWLARPGPDQWKVELVDADSGGFEHATVLADLDGDGLQEIYAAADKQREVRRYRWADGKWDRETLYTIEDAKITFNIFAGKL